MPNASNEFREVQERHRALEKAAFEQVEWIKANLAFAIDELTHWDDGQFYLRTGINLPGMVETFVKGTTNSGIRGVVHLVYALGLKLCDVERSPGDFKKWWEEHRRNLEKKAR